MIEQTKTKSNTAIIRQMFWALLPAQILASATSSLGGIINGIVIGNYLPAEALVALGFASPLMNIVGAIASIMAGGSRILSGHFIGRGEYNKVDDCFSVALVLDVLIGGCISLILIVFASPIAALLGAEAASKAATITYIRGLAIGIIPTLMVPALMSFLQMAGKGTYAFIGSFVLAGSNLLAAIGDVKLFSGSIFGMGMAVTIAQIATAVFLGMRFVISGSNLMQFNASGLTTAMAKEMIWLGSPSALANILYSTRNLIINAVALKKFGEIAVSALAIGNSAIGPFDAVNIGVGAVCLALASMFVGEKDQDAIGRVAIMSLKIGCLLAAIKIAILVIFGKYIAVLFGAEGELIQVTYELIIGLSVCMPFNILTVSLVSPMQAMGKVKFVNILYVFSAFIFPMVYIFTGIQFMGIYGIWSNYLGAEIMTAIMIGIIMAKKCGHLPKSIFDWIDLSEGLDNGSKFTVSLKSVDELVNISERIISFCSEAGASERSSNMCGLCIEELVSNVFEHGEKVDKKYTVDVFVYIEDGNVEFILRNDTPQFDPRSKLIAFDPEDPCNRIGIRMVTKLAKEINYQTIFGHNVLSVKL